MTKDTVQGVRDLMRPFLTVLFSSAYVACLIIVLVKYLATIDQMFTLIGLASTPAMTVIGYHFGKNATKDKDKAVKDK